MEKTFLLEGLEVIAAYFEDRWKPESVKAVMPDLLKEPNEALVRAHARICAEMNPRPFPPIKRIADLIQEEGRRYRMERAGRHEEDWNREKGADSRGRVNGGHGRTLREAAQPARQGRLRPHHRHSRRHPRPDEARRRAGHGAEVPRNRLRGACFPHGPTEWRGAQEADGAVSGYTGKYDFGE